MSLDDMKVLRMKLFVLSKLSTDMVKLIDYFHASYEDINQEQESVVPEDELAYFSARIAKLKSAMTSIEQSMNVEEYRKTELNMFLDELKAKSDKELAMIGENSIESSNIEGK